MSHQQHTQGTNPFGNSQTNPTQSGQNGQSTMPGLAGFGADPAQQRYEPTVRPGDTTHENVANKYAGTGAQAGPTDVYAAHAGQLGTTGDRHQADRHQADPTFGNGNDASRRFDAPGQNPQTHTKGHREHVHPPAVPQPEDHDVQPSVSDKIMGNVEKVAGKISGNEGLTERGQARKSGTTVNFNPDQF